MAGGESVPVVKRSSDDMFEVRGSVMEVARVLKVRKEARIS